MSNGGDLTSVVGDTRPYEATLQYGRSPVPSRPSTPGVSFPPDFVGITPDSGPTVKGVADRCS